MGVVAKEEEERTHALECCHWQQVCCNQVYCHPIALNTSLKVEGENKPWVSFSRRVPVTPCHKRWERLTCKWVRTPWVWGSSRACSRAQGLCQQLEEAALVRAWKGLGKKSIAETQIPINEASGKRSHYVKTPFLQLHSGCECTVRAMQVYPKVHQKQTCQSISRILITMEQLSLLITVSVNSNQNPL